MVSKTKGQVVAFDGSVNSKQNGAWPILTLIALILGLLLGSFSSNISSLGKSIFKEEAKSINYSSEYKYIDKEVYNEVLYHLENEYIEDIGEENAESITYGSLKGLVESLDDPYTVFYSPDEAESYFENLDPDFEGVGIVLQFDTENDATYIESVLSGYPAEKSGVLSNDILLEVDSEDVLGLYPYEVASMIRGEAGSNVKLKVSRKNGNSARSEDLEFNIKREKIQIDNVDWEKIDEKTVVITIRQFSDSSVSKFTASWNKMVNEIVSETPDLDNIIIDVRSNPGGYVPGVRHVMEEFFESGTILFRERKKNQDEILYKDMRTGKFEDKNIVVLVNQGSASASEILASALQENDRAEIVGKETVGKGVEQRLIELSDGSLLVLVFQEWLTSKGNRISKDNVIKPDQDLEISDEDRKNRVDSQLNRALELF